MIPTRSIIEGVAPGVYFTDKGYLREVALGNVPGASLVTKFGRNPGSAMTTLEDVWGAAGSRSTLTSEATMEVVAAVAADDAAGLGARSVIIQGVNRALLPVQEKIATNGGGTSDPSIQKFFRVYRAWVADAGANNVANTGLVSVRVSGAGLLQASILAGIGQSETSHFTVPINKRALLVYVLPTVASNKTTDVTMWQRQELWRTAVPYTSKRKVMGWSGIDLASPTSLDVPVLFPGGTDIWFTTYAAAGSTVTEVTYSLILYDI